MSALEEVSSTISLYLTAPRALPSLRSFLADFTMAAPHDFPRRGLR
jgi:hypothetical protein